MKLALIVLALVPVVAPAQSPKVPPSIGPRADRPEPPQLAWEAAAGPSAIADMLKAGWKFGTGHQGCGAFDPDGKHYDFVPRGDGRCHVEDAR